MRGPQVDLMVMPPGEAGTYRIHFTGSKEHNVRLRAMARDQGWSLSEKGFLRIGEDGEPLTGDDAELRTFAHRGRGLRLPRPAVHRARAARGRRRDRGGAGRPAADARSTPGRPARRPPQPLRLVRRHQPIEVMAEAARRRGYAYQVLTDHTQSLAIARGPDPRPRGRAGARSSPSSTPGSRPRRRPAPRRPRRRPRASACSTAASSRSAPTAGSTTTTTCSPGSTSSSRRSTSSRRQTAGGADAADAQRDPQPARRRHRPPVRAQDRAPRRPRPRLGRRLRRGRADRDGARDERLAAAARPRRRAGAPGGRRSAACCRSTRTPTTSTSSTTSAGGSARRAAPGSSRTTSSTRGRAPTCSPGWPASRGACERLAYHRGDGRPARPPRPRPRRGHRRRAVAAARAAARLGRRGGLLGAMLLGTLQVLADEAAPGRGLASASRSSR